MTRLVLGFLVLGLLLAPGCGTPDLPDPSSPKVLLVGIDGVRVDILKEVDTPVFDALAASGSFSDQARTARPTVSGPAWSSMLTGVWPQKHGVLTNEFSSNRYAEFPDFLTRIELSRPELHTVAVADWLPLVAEDSGGPLISDAADRKIVLDGYELGWLEADSAGVDAAIRELRIGDPDALFVYLGAPDEISHRTGGIGQEYRDAIATADAHLGKLLEAIRDRPSYAREDWLILVGTDHGRTDTGSHGGDSPEEATVFFLAEGPSVERGAPAFPPSIVDIPVTALAHLGITADPDWKLDGTAVGLRGTAVDTLRILAYNTHHGEGLDSVLDVDRIAQVIRGADPDVVTLQEIDVGVERTQARDQAALYGELTGMDPLFGEFMEYQGGQYGMAILTTRPVLEWANHELPPGPEPRSTLAARLALRGSGRSVVVAGIHLYRTEEERLAQARRVMQVFREEEAPVILAGDFNSQLASPVLELLAQEWSLPPKNGDAGTFPADGPQREIDFIFLRPRERFRVLEYRVLDERVASDHRPVLMVVEIR
jgi:endonuclease/exonuclease/phosphatase family metal-dependent hydrolase